MGYSRHLFHTVMPPFRSERFDPYGGGGGGAGAINSTNVTSLNNNTARRRRSVVGGDDSAVRGGNFGVGRNGPPNVTRPHLTGIDDGSIHSRIIGGGHHGDVPSTQYYRRVEFDAKSKSHNNQLNCPDDEIIAGKTGAAALSTLTHPLMEIRKRSNSHRNTEGIHNPYRRGHSSTPFNFLTQSRRIISLLLGQIPEEDHHGLGSSEEEILLNLLSAKSTVRIVRLLLLIPLLIYTSKRIFPPLADRFTRPKAWNWSAGVALPGQKSVARRNLAGRNCVMNYFIEKQPPDEYDPDYVHIKPGEKNKDGTPKVRPPVTIVDGTYRTKGQVHVISRFLEAVADSFRSNTKIRQHIIFAEVRDSGHLASDAVRHWPPRGKHKTIVHVIASDELPHDTAGKNAALALGYGTLENIEERFKGNDRVRIYDRDGNIAGIPDSGEDVDDDEVLHEMEVDAPDRETLEIRLKSGKNGKIMHTNTTLLPDGTRPYPNLRALLPFEDEDDGEGEITVPYLHVDGMTFRDQMLVLESARSLLEDHRVVTVGIEHSPYLDIRILIEFFAQVRYKTFFLGARQVARIDNLCDEVLNDVLDHPSLKQNGSAFRRFFIRLGLISKEELRVSGDKNAPEGLKRRETPPFFVAMPRGRRSKEEMTIQHMYDLFGGYGGGGGQIKTANDRKAPGK